MNRNRVFWVLVLIVVVMLGTYYASTKKTTDQHAVLGFDPKNSTFTVEGIPVTLKDGFSELPITPGGASKVTTRYFGNDVTGDLNNDDADDTAFLITQSTGGSGLFYYAVVALKTPTGYTMTNAFFVGDRIAPQNNEIHALELYINFAERKPGEPMTAQPSVGATLLLKVTPDNRLTGLMS